MVCAVRDGDVVVLDSNPTGKLQIGPRAKVKGPLERVRVERDDSVVAVVGDEEEARRRSLTERHSLRVLQTALSRRAALADGCKALAAVEAQLLDAVVAAIGDVHRTIVVASQSSRAVEPPWRVSKAAERAHKLAAGREADDTVPRALRDAHLPPRCAGKRCHLAS
eukprot:4170573-Prymnesium_polylepis.1